MSKTPEILWPALRQYRHNTDNSPSLVSPEHGFVCGFDYDEVITVVEALQAENKALRELAERTCGDGCHCMAENNGKCALAALQEQGDE